MSKNKDSFETRHFSNSYSLKFSMSKGCIEKDSLDRGDNLGRYY